MRPFALTVVACMLTLTTALAQKAYTGTASGNLILDGKPIALKYAWVTEVDNVEEAGLMPDGPQKYLVLILSDRPLPHACVSDREAPYSDRHSPAQVLQPLTGSVADRMLGVLLRIDPGKKEPLRAQLFCPESDHLSFTVVGTQYPDRVLNLKREGGFLSGTALLSSVQETHLPKGPKQYRYRVTFRAPILTEAPVKEKLEGQAALDSAPVTALKAYLVAGKKGDLDTVRTLTAQSHLAYLKDPHVIDSLQSFDPSLMAQQVRRVVVRGDTATVVVVNTTPNYSQFSMHLVYEQGTWKLYWP